MDLIISNSDGRPIYEQITSQIKALILSGDLKRGEKLPSIRPLANGLRISVITTKRAYTALESQGFIDTVQGPGSFVAGGNMELLREEKRRQIERRLAQVAADARAAGIADSELREMLDLTLEGESQS